MRTNSSILVLATLSTGIFGRVAPKPSDASRSTDVPNIPHPYWWQGHHTESLKDNIYGSKTSIPLPTLQPSSETPCETTSGRVTPTHKSTPTSSSKSEPCETETALPYLPPQSSSSRQVASSSPAPYLSLSRAPASGRSSTLLPTFISSPPSSSSPTPYPILPSSTPYSSATPSGSALLPPSSSFVGHSSLPPVSTPGYPVASSQTIAYPLPESSVLVVYPIPSLVSTAGIPVVPSDTAIYPAPASSSPNTYPSAPAASTPIFSVTPPQSLVSDSAIVLPSSPSSAIQPAPSQESSISLQTPVPTSGVPSASSQSRTYLVVPVSPLPSPTAAPVSTPSSALPSGSPVSTLSNGAIASVGTFSNDISSVILSPSAGLIGGASTVSVVPTASASSAPLPLSSSAIVPSASQAIPSSSQAPPPTSTPTTSVPTTLATETTNAASASSVSSRPSTTTEPSSVGVVGSSAPTLSRSSTAAPRSSAPVQGTGIPLAPSAGGGVSRKGKEKVWWVAFLVPLLLAL